MGRIYAVQGTMAVTTGTTKTALTIMGATGIRARIIEYMISSLDTPNDYNCGFSVGRITTTGTVTSVTPTPLNDKDPAATFTAGSNASAEPTYTAGATLHGPAQIYQRGVFIWKATPGRDEIYIAGTNGVGFLMSPSFGGTVNVKVNALVEEI